MSYDTLFSKFFSSRGSKRITVSIFPNIEVRVNKISSMEELMQSGVDLPDHTELDYESMTRTEINVWYA